MAGGHCQLLDVGVHSRQVVGRLVLVPLERGVDETNHGAVRDGDEHSAVGVFDSRPVPSLDAAGVGCVPERRLRETTPSAPSMYRSAIAGMSPGLRASDGQFGHSVILVWPRSAAIQQIECGSAPKEPRPQGERWEKHSRSLPVIEDQLDDCAQSPRSSRGDQEWFQAVASAPKPLAFRRPPDPWTTAFERSHHSSERARRLPYGRLSGLLFFNEAPLVHVRDADTCIDQLRGPQDREFDANFDARVHKIRESCGVRGRPCIRA
jgi:hypothetical protein